MRQETDYEMMVAFHGHSCPGLAMGYRMTGAALEWLARHSRAEDEELVAITENNACGVDALQFMSGCTFGKGNLIFRDYGKQAYTFFCRESGRGVRVVLDRGAVPEAVKSDRKAYIDWLLTAPEKGLLKLAEVTMEEPERARILKSISCDECGEAVMASRIREVDGKRLCIPCSEKADRPG
jgi:formylmethanofuran dehydrogenase subunit E